MTSTSAVQANVEEVPATESADALLDLYNRWFEVVAADTPSRLHEALRLRYQVYCIENRYEDATEHPDGLERDVFDERSVHSLLLYRGTGETAGTVRLVLPARESRRLMLPVSQLCDEGHLVRSLGLPVETTAEISRFAISKEFRRRATDAHVVDAGFTGFPKATDLYSRRAMPHITLGLMKAVAKMSVENGITHLVAVMEPALLRLVGRLGFIFQPVGPLVDYHGWRQPCYATCHDLGKGVLFRRPEVMDVITESGEYWRPFVDGALSADKKGANSKH